MARGRVGGSRISGVLDLEEIGPLSHRAIEVRACSSIRFSRTL